VPFEALWWFVGPIATAVAVVIVESHPMAKFVTV